MTYVFDRLKAALVEQLSAISFQLEVAISDRPAESRLSAATTRGDELGTCQ